MTRSMSGRVTNVAVRGDAYRRTMRLVEVGGAWSSCTSGGRRACAGTASSFRHGAAARARRAAAGVRGRDRRGDRRAPPWLERQLAKPPEPRLGLDRLTADRGAGPPRGARPHLADRPVGGGRARRRATRGISAARPAQPLGLVLEHGHAQLQLAARARAARRPRLRRRPRGLPPRRAQPRAGVLEARRERRPGYREPKRWLDEHGWEILAYRPPGRSPRSRQLQAQRVERWATFDCYGTLIDWDGGVRAELARVFGDDRADELLARYHEVEPELQRDGDAHLPRGADRDDAPARRARRRGARPRRVAARLAGVPRGARRARGAARAAAGGSRSSRTPTTTSSPPRRCRSASRSTRSSSRRRSARTSRRTATGRSSSRARARRARGTCTSPPGSSTTSRRRTSSACAASGSTGSARRRRRCAADRELPISFALPETLDELVPA